MRNEFECAYEEVKIKRRINGFQEAADKAQWQIGNRR
jgi:hypothetical protein